MHSNKNPRNGINMSLLAKSNLKKLVFGAGFSIIAFSFSPSFAGCHFVSCPNSTPPIMQEYHQNSYSSIDTSQYDDDNYKQGYKDGMRAANSNSKTRVITKVVYKNSAKKTAPKRVNYKATKVRTHKTYTSTSARSNYSYNPTPMRDHASTYHAQNGQSVSALEMMGRGESWQSSYVRIVRYSTPMVIQNVNGKSCGWGNPITSDGHYMQKQAYVCHCAQGWQLPR